MRCAQAGERRRLAQRQQVVAQGGLGAGLAVASMRLDAFQAAALGATGQFRVVHIMSDVIHISDPMWTEWGSDWWRDR